MVAFEYIAFFAKNLAVKDPPSLKFQNRTDISMYAQPKTQILDYKDFKKLN